MGLNRFKAFSLSIFLTAAPLCAFAGSMGGSEGGGGNANSSTRQDLEEIVKNFDRHLWEISDNYLFGGPISTTKTLLKPELANITSTVLGAPAFNLNSETITILKKSKFVIVDGPCMDGGKETDASTFYKRESEICLSAPRLARFPKSVLREALVPLLFHELAHQYGLGEAEANALQQLAEIQLKYRPIYLSGHRAHIQCAFVTKANLSVEQKNEVLEMIKPYIAPGTKWPKLKGDNRSQAMMACAQRASGAGEALERTFNGSLWQHEDRNGLSPREKATLVAYRNNPHFAFLSITGALTEPSVSGYNNCDVCKRENIDPAYLMMLGGKAAVSYIDSEVGIQQNAISIR
jgi:hypothetical protein